MLLCTRRPSPSRSCWWDRPYGPAVMRSELAEVILDVIDRSSGPPYRLARRVRSGTCGLSCPVSSRPRMGTHPSACGWTGRPHPRTGCSASP